MTSATQVRAAPFINSVALGLFNDTGFHDKLFGMGIRVESTGSVARWKGGAADKVTDFPGGPRINSDSA